MTGTELPWLPIALALALLVALVAALALAVPFALAVVKAVAVGWAARALLRRLSGQAPEWAPLDDAARPPTRRQEYPETKTSTHNGEAP